MEKKGKKILKDAWKSVLKSIWKFQKEIRTFKKRFQRTSNG